MQYFLTVMLKPLCILFGRPPELTRAKSHILGGEQFFVGLFVPCINVYVTPTTFLPSSLPDSPTPKTPKWTGQWIYPPFPQMENCCFFHPACAHQCDLTAAAGPKGGWKGTDRPNGFSLRTFSLYGTLVIFHLPVCCSRLGLAYRPGSRNAVKCGASRTFSSREGELIASDS